MTPGTKLGPYEIVSPIGAGGMGEVYKARDTRLDRTVAVKVLPSHIAAREDLRARFEREARAVSSLNHPHICVLHDIGQQDGVDYIVLEHLEGETLFDRLQRGPLPLDQALKYAMQIADAVDRAHRSGVIHRDLKPGNIMLTRDGAKVLDFGLAKTAPKSAADGATMTMALTSEGTVLGTPQYMAPEQIEGREADARSDIFAFGCVLYEMVTGKRAFDGKTKGSVIGAILSADPPPMSSLQPVTPAALEKVVRRCLTKDPDDRSHCLRDVLLELRSIGAPEKPLIAGRRLTPQVWMGVTAVVAALAMLGGWLARPRAATPSVYATLNLSGKVTFQFAATNGGGSAVSPDGTTLAFAGLSEGKTLLWVRRLDSPAARPLPGTEGAHYPFWSPDSRSVGYFTPDKLRRIEVAGGLPQTVCDAPGGRGGAWSSDNVIVYSATSTGRSIHRVPAAGGKSVPLTKVDMERKENSHYWPSFLPDGRHFLYLIRSSTGGESAIFVAPLDAPNQRKPVIAANSNAVYSQGHILFARDQTLMAQAFDPGALEVKGDPFPVVEQIGIVPNISLGDFSASVEGVLAYGAGAGILRRFAWVDRSGKQSLSYPAPGAYNYPSVSPDGKLVAFTRDDPASGGRDVWVMDVARNTTTRLTFAEQNNAPIWSPGGDQVAYLQTTVDRWRIYRKPANGVGEPVLILDNTGIFPMDWSPDGRFLLARANDTSQGTPLGTAILAVPTTGHPKPIPVIQSKFRMSYPRFSPDGRWIAYAASSEGGLRDVFVQAFSPNEPPSAARWQVSSGGGSEPRWRRDGKELFYLSSTGEMMSVGVRTAGAAFQTAPPVPLFDSRLELADAGGWRYDVSPDGQRFIVAQLVEDVAGAPMNLVVNWLAGARK